MQKLLTHEGDQDRYIVAVGFVTSDQKNLLGVLYGAGAVGSLDANRIFARWLQKRVVMDGKIEPAEAIGPDRAVIKTNDSLKGSLELFDDDGNTRIAVANRVELRPGHAYQLEMKK
jgi:hypothetical protein